MKWKAGLALLGVLAGTPALALFTTGDALVIGNARYDDLNTGFGPAEVEQTASALRLRGQQVEALANGDPAAIAQAFDAFVDAIPAGEGAPLIAVLSGKFTQGADGPYLLPAGTGQGAGLSLNAVLQVLAQNPRRAFLVLGEVGFAPGLGDLDIPDGVTVIRGAPDKVAQFAAREMAQPAARLSRTAGWYDLVLEGYQSDTLVVLEHTDVRPPTEAEETAALDRMRLVDEAIWQRALDAGNPSAYLDSFPQGRYADEAQQHLVEAALALDLPARKSIQLDLTRLGLNTGGIDGVFGPVTRASITTWQGRIGLEVTGFLDAAQIARLAKQAGALAPRIAARTNAAAAKPPTGSAVSAHEAVLWQRAKGEAGLSNYLSQYPNGAHSERARVLKSNLQRGFGG